MKLTDYKSYGDVYMPRFEDGKSYEDIANEFIFIGDSLSLGSKLEKIAKSCTGFSEWDLEGIIDCLQYNSLEFILNFALVQLTDDYFIGGRIIEALNESSKYNELTVDKLKDGVVTDRLLVTLGYHQDGEELLFRIGSLTTLDTYRDLRFAVSSLNVKTLLGQFEAAFKQLKSNDNPYKRVYDIAGIVRYGDNDFLFIESSKWGTSGHILLKQLKNLPEYEGSRLPSTDEVVVCKRGDVSKAFVNLTLHGYKYLKKHGYTVAVDNFFDESLRRFNPNPASGYTAVGDVLVESSKYPYYGRGFKLYSAPCYVVVKIQGGLVYLREVAVPGVDYHTDDEFEFPFLDFVSYEVSTFLTRGVLLDIVYDGNNKLFANIDVSEVTEWECPDLG